LFNVLYDDTQENLKTLIQESANTDAEKGSNTQKLGDMYNSYMNVDLTNKKGILPLQSLLDTISSAEDMSQLSKVFGEFYVLGVGGAFNFYTSPDAKDPDMTTMYLYQGGLTLPDRDYYNKNEEKFVNFRTATEKYMADILIKAGLNSGAGAANNIMALEKDIATKHLSRVESRDAEKNYNKQSTVQVKELLGSFDWQTYADASGVGQVSDMVVRNMPYFEEIAGIFATHNLQTWKDYLTFHLIDTYASRLSQDIVDLHFDFHSTTLNGIPEQSPRWKRAVASTSSILGEVLGQQYVERQFPKKLKQKWMS
jgi:putative endopeptidase